MEGLEWNVQSFDISMMGLTTHGYNLLSFRKKSLRDEITIITTGSAKPGGYLVCVIIDLIPVHLKIICTHVLCKML